MVADGLAENMYESEGCDRAYTRRWVQAREGIYNNPRAFLALYEKAINMCIYAEMLDWALFDLAI